MTHLALDGPYNGTYLDELTARRNGYSLSMWSTGEEVWIHESAAHLNPDDPEVIINAILDAEIR